MTLIPRGSAKCGCGGLTASSVGFRFAANRYTMRVAHWSDGMGRRLTLKSSSRRKRSCGKMNASFAGLPTRYRRRLLSWTRLARRSTPTNRRSIIRDSLLKMCSPRAFANESSTRTTSRDYGTSERPLSHAGFRSKSNNEPCGRTAGFVARNAGKKQASKAIPIK